MKKQLTFSIYQTEEERLLNKPKRKSVPNVQLEVEMERYKQKIENKFKASTINNGYTFPRPRDNSPTPFQKKTIEESYGYSPEGSIHNVINFSEGKKKGP